jgi:hypothetical protein
MIPPYFKVIQKNNNASIEFEALHVLLNSKNRTFFSKQETVVCFYSAGIKGLTFCWHSTNNLRTCTVDYTAPFPTFEQTYS